MKWYSHSGKHFGIFLKTTHKTLLGPSNCNGHLSQRNESWCLSQIYPKLETTQIHSTGQLLNILWYGILLRNTKKWTMDACNKLDESPENYGTSWYSHTVWFSLSMSIAWYYSWLYYSFARCCQWDKLGEEKMRSLCIISNKCMQIYNYLKIKILIQKQKENVTKSKTIFEWY